MCVRRLVILSLFITLTTGCGGDGTTGPQPGGSAAFSASIDGSPWQSDAIYLTVTAGGASTPGALVINGSQVMGATTRSVLLVLGFLEGPGEYPLGVNISTTGGGTGQVVEGTTSNLTPLNGDAGSITFTALGGGRAVGTFAFTAPPITGGGASRVVTNGAFDLALPSNFAPVTGDGRGSTMSATVGGAAFVGATNLSVGTPGAYAVTGSNTAYQITISTLATGLGSYSIGSGVSVQVLQVGGTNGWGAAGSAGTVTVTGGGTARLIGTFAGTLTPIGGTGSTLTVANGAFDIRIP